MKGERHELPCIRSTSFGSSQDSRLAVEVEIKLPKLPDCFSYSLGRRLVHMPVRMLLDLPCQHFLNSRSARQLAVVLSIVESDLLSCTT